MVDDVVQIFAHLDVLPDVSLWCEERMMDVSFLPSI